MEAHAARFASDGSQAVWLLLDVEATLIGRVDLCDLCSLPSMSFFDGLIRTVVSAE